MVLGFNILSIAQGYLRMNIYRCKGFTIQRSYSCGKKYGLHNFNIFLHMAAVMKQASTLKDSCHDQSVVLMAHGFNNTHFIYELLHQEYNTPMSWCAAFLKVMTCHFTAARCLTWHNDQHANNWGHTWISFSFQKYMYTGTQNICIHADILTKSDKYALMRIKIL